MNQVRIYSRTMNFAALAVFLAASFQGSLAEGQKDQDDVIWPKIFHVTPLSEVFNMQIREFYECVSCNDVEDARAHFDFCLWGLSHKNLQIYHSCYKSHFGDFGVKESIGKMMNYESVCKNPKKGIEVERCFWKKQTDKESFELNQFRQCKKQILSKHCTSLSYEKEN